SAAVACGRRGGQDPGQQRHDRPRGGEGRAAALRGAGRLQVARAAPVRRLLLLRRRGERGREPPPPGRHRLGDRQGRPDHVTARTSRDPGELYRALTDEFGTPYYARIDAPATPAEKTTLARLSPAAVKADTLAGEPILARLTRAPGNDAPIGGLKVVAETGW